MISIKFEYGDLSSLRGQSNLAVYFVNKDDNLRTGLRTLAEKFEVELPQIAQDEIKGDISFIPRSGSPSRVLISVTDPGTKMTADYFRNYMADLTAGFYKNTPDEVFVQLPEHTPFSLHFPSKEQLYLSLMEGMFLGVYKFDKYKSDKSADKEVTVYLSGLTAEEFEGLSKIAEAVKEGVYFTRTLANEPANVIYPESFIGRLQERYKDLPLEFTIFRKKELEENNMGGILAVGGGSSKEPALCVVRYTPAASGSGKHISLVGKGVTFDSGGISIKPPDNMGWMRADMAGAAVVAGTLLTAALLGVEHQITGVMPLAENMLDGSSMRPGDIVITASGKSIEVDNTDAEGRMILADALHYAGLQKPDQIIDLATLTGACAVALGLTVAGLFTKDETLAADLYNSGLHTYERVWRLPMWDEYHTYNSSDVADVKNVGGRYGGAITAAKFLENFVDSAIPWAHIDIAAPSMMNSHNNYQKTYMTGFGVRLLTDYLRRLK